MRVAIWWIRRDLRLSDNPALEAALANADLVIPLFVLDPSLLRSEFVGEKRLAFLFAALHALDRDLTERGSRLIVRQGNPFDELRAAVAHHSVESIWAEEDYSPYARRRDASVQQELPIRMVGSPAIQPPGSVLKSDGTPYKVFTPFSRAWKDLSLADPVELSDPPARVPLPEGLRGDEIPQPPRIDSPIPFPAGEEEAERRLTAFTRGNDAPIYSYALQRDRMGASGTSVLSPYLRFGMLSGRRAAVAAWKAIEDAPAAEARRGAEAWLNELIWRDFYLHILHHYPHARTRAFRGEYTAIPWNNDENEFESWCAGRTGYPIVDAGMRQLAQTGWMHNRARMIVASFLVKDLLINWQWGERWFMQQLVDGDPASNNGGWQWVAGTGTDAAPYFRIFNPVSQSRKHDPDGEYVRRWVPELRNVPKAFIHEPWRMPEEVQEEADCIIGRDYPEPLIDHAEARKQTLDAYAFARDAHGAGS